VLSDEERDEIMEELKRHEHKRAACVPVLKIVQRRRGWVSDEIRDIAPLLDMTAEELDGVATFFSNIYTSQPGKHMISICDSISCWVMGYDMIREHLFNRLGIRPGETTRDGQFTLLPVACLGACDEAPVMMIDDTLYTRLTVEKIDEALKQYE
jgi:NADH-quinone oxidoreductase subunit E